MSAPLHCGFLFCQNNRVFHLVAGLWLQHVDDICRFSDKVGLIFGVIRALTIEDRKLPLGRLEPLEGVALENPRAESKTPRLAMPGEYMGEQEACERCYRMPPAYLHSDHGAVRHALGISPYKAMSLRKIPSSSDFSCRK